MIKINAIGDNCPIPVIKTKKALKGLEQDETLIVSVDNRIATENLEKMANELGHKISIEKIENNNYEVTITVGEGNLIFSEDENVKNGKIVVISSDKMGTGDENFGKTLLKGFIFSLTESDVKPEKIIFYNSGAYLSTEGSDSIEDLKNLEEAGVEIYTCGACLNYYGIESKLKVGQVTNMYYISNYMLNADSVIKP